MARQRSASFVVRLWERGQDQTIWYGEVEHIESSRRSWFHSAAEMEDFVAQTIAESGQIDSPTPDRGVVDFEPSSGNIQGE